MKSCLLTIALCTLIVSVQSMAGEKFANTLSIENHTAQSASIEQLSWMAGTWRGQNGSSTIEVLWSEPLAGSIMGVFKSVKSGKVRFYEILTIAEQKDSLVLKLKHFSSDLTGWEEKDEYMQRDFIKVENNRAYFDGYTFEMLSNDSIAEHVVVTDDKTGKQSELSFTFQRVN